MDRPFLHLEIFHDAENENSSYTQKLIEIYVTGYFLDKFPYALLTWATLREGGVVGRGVLVVVVLGWGGG